ncbi:MAG TPA: thermonuclease family protein [Acidimicrobiales bacterium]|nr:thermonuclease family protein [Acidimicrobiales bacterium]
MARNGRDWPTAQIRRRPRTLWSDLAGLGRRFGRLPFPVRIGLAIVATVLLLLLLSRCLGSDDGQDVVTRSPTSTSEPTTTTTLALPPGDDKTVKGVLDGDSLELTDATKVRLIGIDAPDVETRACFSGEATAHLGELLPAESPVRVVYDESRTDRLGRTLAYVYRLSDGLFVNDAMARDGFARQLTTPPNTAHAEEIKAAVEEAVAQRRGMWQACPTTTTTRRPTTTRPRATVPATAAPTTPETTAPPPASDTTVTPDPGGAPG